MAEQETNITQTDVQTEQADTGEEQAQTEQESAEVAKLKAELARFKAATDKATKEAADYRKQLRSKLSADEIAAEEKRIADEARDKELTELRKRFAVAETSKKIMTLGCDEGASSRIAEYLYGAEDVEGALQELQKAWTAREKALRLEFGKIPRPGAGGSGSEDDGESEAVRRAREIGKARADAVKSANDAMKAYLR